ncbi:hypothetical protein D3C73_1419690 [compost metagenome]
MQLALGIRISRINRVSASGCGRQLGATRDAICHQIAISNTTSRLKWPILSHTMPH